jgi:UDP-3-O-acyl-N-acetylglucosamine deacetylase
MVQFLVIINPVEWADIISLRAMIGVVTSTTNDNDWKVDIARMIAAIRTTGDKYIEWYPMRGMKVREWIDFDESLIPQSHRH